jgi:hypothetical protein
MLHAGELYGLNNQLRELMIIFGHACETPMVTSIGFWLQGGDKKGLNF